MDHDHPWRDDPALRDDDALRGVLDGLAATTARPVPPAVRQDQVQAILAEVAGQRRTRPARRRVRSVLALTGVKVVLVGGVAAAGTTTGLATTGTLPAPAQQWAHEVGARIGVGLPAAPGQAAKVDGDPDSNGRDHAPGQVTKDDPDRNGRDAAPGQVGRDDGDPTTGPPGHRDRATTDDAPGRSGTAPGRSGTAPGQG